MFKSILKRHEKWGCKSGGWQPWSCWVMHSVNSLAVVVSSVVYSECLRLARSLALSLSLTLSHSVSLGHWLLCTKQARRLFEGRLFRSNALPCNCSVAVVPAVVAGAVVVVAVVVIVLAWSALAAVGPLIR